MDTKPRGRPSKEELERQLDAALEATFPASDPVAVGQPTGTKPIRPVDRAPACIDKELVEQLAEEVPKRIRKKKAEKR